MAAMIGWWVHTTRAKEWDYSKLALCLLPLLVEANHSPENAGLQSWLGAMLFLVGFFASAYLENDIWDAEVDKAAGKARGIHTLSAGARQGVLWGHVALSVSGILLMDLHSTWIAVMGIAGSYGALFTYSRPPVRWKERGIGGLVIAAAGQRAFPMLVVASMAAAVRWEVWFLMTLSLLQGFRWILIHQIQDATADAAGGVRTWSTARGEHAALAAVRRVVFPTEVALSGAFAVAASVSSLVLAMVFGLYLLMAMARYALQPGRGTAAPWVSFDYVPGANFLLLAVPAAYLVLGVRGNQSWVPAAISFTVTSARYAAWQVEDFLGLMRRRMQPCP